MYLKSRCEKYLNYFWHLFSTLKVKKHTDHYFAGEMEYMKSVILILIYLTNEASSTSPAANYFGKQKTHIPDNNFDILVRSVEVTAVVEILE